jgi:hypothetical protein
MTSISVKLKPADLELLIALAADQLFRLEFIDPKMPGHKANHAEVSRGKELVNRLKLVLDPASAKKKSLSKLAG